MGVWIEILWKIFYDKLAESLPLVGVWIEIIIEKGLDKIAPGHSPWWECGLKLLVLQLV